MKNREKESSERKTVQVQRNNVHTFLSKKYRHHHEIGLNYNHFTHHLSDVILIFAALLSHFRRNSTYDSNAQHPVKVRSDRMYESIIKTRTNFIKTETKQHKVESELMKLVMAKKVRIRKSGNRSFSFVHTISSAFCRIRIETENCSQRTINVSWNMKQGYSVSNRHTQRDRQKKWNG